MDKWVGKVALVTGASAGIGAAILVDLAKLGVISIGMARRVEKMEELKSSLSPDIAKNVHYVKGDVRDEENVREIFKWIKEKFGGVNILINNAGVVRGKLVLTDDDSTEAYKDIIHTNFMGLLYCTREAYKQLKQNDDYGYIVNINSVAGHVTPVVPGHPPLMNVYSSSKHAVTALSEVIRQEIMYYENKKVRITSISPGCVDTEIALVGMGAIFSFDNVPHLKSDDISQAILYVLSTPNHVQVKELMIKPVGEQM